MLPGHVFYFFNVATSVYCTLLWIRIKVSLARRKYFLQTLESSKLRWSEILPLEPRNYFPFGANLDLPWDWIFLEIPLWDYSLFFLLKFNILILSWGTKWTNRLQISWQTSGWWISWLIFAASPLPQPTDVVTGPSEKNTLIPV